MLEKFGDDGVANGVAAGPMVDDAAGGAVCVWLAIRPNNPQGRDRKLEVNSVAKTKQQEDVTNGPLPVHKKGMKRKMASNKVELEANMIKEWEAEVEDAKTKAPEKGAFRKRAKKERPIKHRDAVAISPFGSHNAQTMRTGIQAKCQIPDGSTKTIGIAAIVTKEGVEAKVWSGGK